MYCCIGLINIVLQCYSPCIVEVILIVLLLINQSSLLIFFKATLEERWKEVIDCFECYQEK
jgi:hypothetical protein